MCKGKRSQPSPMISARLINKAMNSRSKGCKNTDSVTICVNKHSVASPATGTSLQFNWASVHTKRMETKSADLNALNLWSCNEWLNVLFCVCFFVFWWFYKRTRAQNSEWTEAAVSIGTHHSSDVSRKRTTSVKQSFNQKHHYSCLTWSQEENWTVVCHLLLVHSFQSSQYSELRSSKGFKKTFCFRLLTSFTQVLFSFSRRTLSRPAESNHEQLVGWLWLYCAWLAAPTIQMSRRLVSKQPDVEATWPIVGWRSENNFSNTDLCYKSSFCFALKWVSS